MLGVMLHRDINGHDTASGEPRGLGKLTSGGQKRPDIARESVADNETLRNYRTYDLSRRFRSRETPPEPRILPNCAPKTVRRAVRQANTRASNDGGKPSKLTVLVASTHRWHHVYRFRPPTLPYRQQIAPRVPFWTACFAVSPTDGAACTVCHSTYPHMIVDEIFFFYLLDSCILRDAASR